MISREHYILYIDYNYALLCKYCNQKSLDPEKIKGQKYLTCKCPKCGFDPEECSIKIFKRMQQENVK